MQPGIYVLVLAGEPADLMIGSLGTISFQGGYYCYVGSALGPGGLVRVLRHIRLAKNKNRRPRWHIDYLLIQNTFSLLEVFCARTGERLECNLATAIILPVVQGFGSSDCSCAGHLFYSPEDPGLLIRKAFKSLSLNPVIRSL